VKAFLGLTAAVLAVIGVGVALVDGLPTVSNYSLGGVQFVLSFPAALVQQPVRVSGFRVPCLYADSAAATKAHLSLLVIVAEPGSCASSDASHSALGFNTAVSFITETPLSCPGPASSHRPFPPPARDDFRTRTVDENGYLVMLMAESCNGTSELEGVLNSFQVVNTAH
jgi:hypothetical protein